MDKLTYKGIELHEYPTLEDDGEIIRCIWLSPEERARCQQEMNKIYSALFAKFKAA